MLKRLGHALHRQDWATIAIEFVLLVLGVFLGIQVANWNEDRQLEARRSAALSRLHAESEAAIAYLERRMGVIAGEADLRTEALRRLSDNDWEGADPVQMAEALDSIQYAPAVSPPRGVYDELISTGLYSELGDPRLRKAVSDYIAQLAYLERQVDFIRARLVARNDGRLFQGARPVFDPGARRQIRTAYDFPALSADPAFVANTVENNAATIAQVDWTRDLLDKAKAMCAEIARIEGQPCKAPVENAP
ncbi:MAG: hypothetical protein J0L59_03390 [Xanthomonadales bacterium]|nr:hypothetical protein [Xanthomonadales bacterium]